MEIKESRVGWKPLLKTQYVNLPISIPEPWKEFFDQQARKLGISRNAAVCLALRFGGPILEAYFDTMKRRLQEEYEHIGSLPGLSKILGTAQPPGKGGKKGP